MFYIGTGVVPRMLHHHLPVDRFREWTGYFCPFAFPPIILHLFIYRFLKSLASVPTCLIFQKIIFK